MNEICWNCGKPENEHDDGNFCPRETPGFDNPLDRYEPSGRVVVPVEFIEAVRDEIKKSYCLLPSCIWMDYDAMRAKVLSMLDQMEGGEGR